MGIFDKAKDALSTHSDKVDAGLDKLGNLVDERTDGKHSEQIDQGVAAAKERLDEQRQQGQPPA